MKLLFDFLPIIIFFIAFKLFNIYVATAAAIGISFIQVAFHWYRHRNFDKMQLVTLVLIAVLGGLTLFLHNEMFIKWKPSVINWLFGVVFLASQWTQKKPLIQTILEKNIKLPDFVWLRLNLSWVVFFLTMGFANIYVVYHYSTNTWVNFKLFGILGITLIFVIGQSIYLARHIEPDSADNKKEAKQND